MNRPPRNFMRAMAAGRALARLLAALALVQAGAVVAQTITTIAGRGVQDGGPASSAPVSYPQGVAFDSAGNLYIADHYHHRIRKVAAGTNVISTVAGDGTNLHTGDGGPATGAGVGYPQGIAVDPSSGNIYFSALNRVRRVDAATGTITTIAGSALPGFSGDGGLATSATLRDPRGLAFDSSGNLYISDSGNHRIRKLDPGTGVITTVAGNGTAAFSGDGGAATAASLNAPSGIAFDPLGFLVFADSGNDRVRRIALFGAGGITTVAGGGASLADGVLATSAQIANPQGVAFDAAGKILYVSDGNSRIRDIDLQTGNIYTAAGSGVSGYSGDGGQATSANINYLAPGMALDASGNLHFSDALNHRVRKVVIGSGVISTVAGTGVVNGVAATSADLYLPRGMAIDGNGNLYFADYFGRRIRKLTTATGVLSTLAGQDGFAASSEGVPATSATVWYPFGVAVDTSTGNAYFTEYFKSKSSRVRTVAPGGNVTTLAGANADGFGGDGGLPASALLNNPKAVAVDVQGNVYIADTDNHRIRKVTKSTGLITTVAGNGTAAFTGDGGPATSASLSMPGGIAVDGAGNLYIADTGNNRVRKVTSGTITTIGGDGTCCYSGDYGPATSARLYPGAIAVDSVGNVFIADFSSRVRRMDATTGLITTVAGTGTQGFSGDGGPATTAMLNAPGGVAVDTSGNLYIADNYNARIRKVTPDTSAPDTTIVTRPPANTAATNAIFAFGGNDGAGGATGFQCSLDGAAYAACSATTTFTNLSLGAHTLQVRAVDAWGNIDASPVVYTWNVGLGPALSTTSSHTLALDTTGLVYAWGNDSLGQLGQGRKINRLTPTQVPGLARIVHVSLQRHALAVDAFKQVWSWGDNSCGGQLGPRESANTSRPSRVTGANGVTRVAAGRCFSLALRADGTVVGWGLVPGHGTVTSVRQIPGLAGIVEIAAGTAHALARRNDGAVFALGENAAGQLGQATVAAVSGVVQVPGVAGATAIAAGDASSMVLLGTGQLLAWGRVGNGSVVSSPAPLAPTGGTALAISIGGNTPYAVRADGALLQYSAASAGWSTVSGYAGLKQVTSSGIIATQEFVMGVNAAGQLFASGTNTSGQLGQGDTASRAGATAVPGFSNTLMVATGMQVPGVLAVKSDGTVWFWGADTTGQSGDGTIYLSSIPRSVSIPATIRQVATGYRFSVALDTTGSVWGWGDNNAGAFGDLVSRSSPALVDGIANVQAVAAGGDGLVVYLMADGTVKKSGYMPISGGNLAIATVSGLSGIVAVAAGDGTLYALRSDGKVFALGENGSGELGNGSNTASAAPVQVTDIAGSVVRIVAGKGRAAAITSDGKVWAWGAAPLGNGTTAASPTAVPVTGIADASDIVLGADGALVLRSDGTLMAWGNLGLADATGQDTTRPYSVAFTGTARAIAAGPSNTVGYVVGSTGLTLGFGNFGKVTGAAIGDGTYVARTRPVVVLAPDGTGAVDAANWYLDLDGPSPTAVPAALVPRSLGTSSVFGVDTGLSLTATVKYRNADVGKRINHYVLGLVPPAFFNLVKTAPQVSPEPKLQAKAKDAGGFVLANLTPAGWTDVNGQLIAYSQGTANAAGGAVNILNGVNSTLIPGARFCIGYGESSGSMLTAQSLTEVLTLEGASSSSSGVPCVLTGIYVEGPSSSTSGSPVTFSSSVVGIAPSGSVQFQDGGANLLSPVTLSASNEAVARGEISTAALTVGVHSIGASYSGDGGQNPAASATVPVRHEVVAAAPGASVTTLSGPSSSAPGSEVVLTATVAGAQPSGTVQFRDGATNLGVAVPLVGGTATLRIDTLAEGSHSITAAYSGDGANAASASGALAHTVYEAITTSISLASSASTTTVVGTTVTFTATVSGTNPTGNVVFRDGATVIGTVALANGVASISVSNFDAGQHVITAEYTGDGTSTNAAVTSAAVFQQVSLATPSVTVFQASPSTLAFGGQSMNTTSPAQTVTLTNAGAAAVTVNSVTASTYFAVTHTCGTVNAGASCAATVSFTPAAQGALTGTLSIATGAGTQTIELSGTGERSLTTHYYRSILRRAPDAGGKAFWDAEAARVQALGVNVNEVWFAMAGSFYGSPEYLAFNRDDDGYVTDLYSTFFNRAPDAGGFADWKAQLAAGMPREVVLASFMFSAEFANFTQAIFGTTSTRKEVDTVVDFYRGLLGSLPDDGGFNFWLAQFRTAQCAGGAAVNTQVETISSAFANSAQYANRGRTNGQYIGDLYNAFLRRGAPGDLAGVQFWINQVASAAQTREQVRQAFVASPEFQGRVAAIIAQGCLP